MGFPRQEDWSGLPFPSPGDLPDPGIQPRSPTLTGRFFTTEPLGKPIYLSDQISCSVVSDSLRPHESQHARPPCPSPTPRVHGDSCPSSHIYISSLLSLPPISIYFFSFLAILSLFSVLGFPGGSLVARTIKNLPAMRET